jgi:hypothetical protein
MSVSLSYQYVNGVMKRRITPMIWQGLPYVVTASVMVGMHELLGYLP